MEQYIPKSVILEEIENLLDKGKYYDDYDCVFRDGNNSALYRLKGKLNSLVVNTSNPLTLEDIKLIWNIGDEIPYMPEEDFFKELLKRFKEEKGEKV